MIKTYKRGGFFWLESEEIQNYPEKRKRIQGKYLFFAAQPEDLVKVAEKQIRLHQFPIAKIVLPEAKIVLPEAKIVLPEAKIMDDFVLCLYNYEDNASKSTLERFRAYEKSDQVQFARWKSEEETKRGEYEPEFLERVKKIRQKTSI